MFERKTVFIVGAGASREVDFPMGAQLTGLIARKLDIRFKDGYSLTKGDREIVEAIRFKLQQAGDRDPNPHHHAGRAIASAMGQAISIDNYLHSHATDELVVWMGKIGIARSILEAESKSLLAPDRDRDDILNLSRSEDTWYNTFFQMLHEGVQRSDLSQIFSNVSFITFNYDRCIEHYIAHALANYYRIALHDAEVLTRSLRVEHPYGQVGRLPWQEPRGAVAFGKKVQPRELPEIAGQIRTFTERTDDDRMLNRMRQLISEAQVVVYLGFSFGDMNLKLLTVDEADDKVIFGTSYGLSAPNKRVIEKDIVNSMGPDKSVVTSVDLADMTCNEFLKSYWKPIIRG